MNWWLRSPYSATAFYNINTNGNSNNNNATNSNNWLRPVLNVSNDTLVSDEGAEQIFILPDPDKAYNEVDFKVKVGELERRPNKALVKYEAENLYDVSVKITNKKYYANFRYF